jgi:hypothetical protein
MDFFPLFLLHQCSITKKSKLNMVIEEMSSTENICTHCQYYQFSFVFLLHCKDIIKQGYFLSDYFCLTMMALWVKGFCNYFKNILYKLLYLPLIRITLMILSHFQFLNFQDKFEFCK